MSEDQSEINIPKGGRRAPSKHRTEVVTTIVPKRGRKTESRAFRKLGNKDVNSKADMKSLFDENSGKVRAMRGSGLSNEQIAEALGYR